jgi:hypothetical protein
MCAGGVAAACANSWEMQQLRPLLDSPEKVGRLSAELLPAELEREAHRVIARWREKFAMHLRATVRPTRTGDVPMMGRTR